MMKYVNISGKDMKFSSPKKTRSSKNFYLLAENLNAEKRTILSLTNLAAKT